MSGGLNLNDNTDIDRRATDRSVPRHHGTATVKLFNDANWWMAASAVVALLVSAVALYTQYVFVSHTVTCSVLDLSATDGKLSMDLLFSNGGNRTVAIALVVPYIGEPVGRIEDMLQLSTPGGVTPPVILPGGDIQRYVRTYPVQMTDLDRLGRSGSVRVVGAVQVINSFGDGSVTFVELGVFERHSERGHWDVRMPGAARRVMRSRSWFGALWP